MLWALGLPVLILQIRLAHKATAAVQLRPSLPAPFSLTVPAHNPSSRMLHTHTHIHPVVFKMHYQELLMKNEEIERLKSVIEGLGGGG